MNIASGHFLTYICTNQDRMDNKQANPHISVVELNLCLLLTCLFSALALATTDGGWWGELMEQISFNRHLEFYAKWEKNSRGSKTHDSMSLDWLMVQCPVSLLCVVHCPELALLNPEGPRSASSHGDGNWSTDGFLMNSINNYMILVRVWFFISDFKEMSIDRASVQFSHSVVSDSLRPHESQHARPPCPLPTPGVHSDSRPLSQRCHPAISPLVVPFSSCP